MIIKMTLKQKQFGKIVTDKVKGSDDIVSQIQTLVKFYELAKQYKKANVFELIKVETDSEYVFDMFETHLSGVEVVFLSETTKKKTSKG